MLATTKNTSAVAGYTRVYSYFEKGCRKNMQAIIPKGNMGYDNYLLLLVSFSTRKHISTAFRTYSFKFLQRTVNLKPPTMPFGIVACTFPTIFLEIAVNTRKFKGLDSREVTSLPEIEKVIYMARHFYHRRKQIASSSQDSFAYSESLQHLTFAILLIKILISFATTQ